MSVENKDIRDEEPQIAVVTGASVDHRDLKLATIRIDGGTQPRAAIDDELVDDYTEALGRGIKFPPVDVFFDGETYWFADGFHRCRSYEKLKKQKVPATIHQGTQADAQWFSYGVNATHGQRRTNADVGHAVKAALKHPKARGMSDRAVAEHCGVSHETVRKYRAGAAASCQFLTRAVREGRDGKMYQPTRPRVKAVTCSSPGAPPESSCEASEDEGANHKATDTVAEARPGERTASGTTVVVARRVPMGTAGNWPTTVEVFMADPAQAAADLNAVLGQPFLVAVCRELQLLWAAGSDESSPAPSSAEHRRRATPETKEHDGNRPGLIIANGSPSSSVSTASTPCADHGRGVSKDQ